MNLDSRFRGNDKKRRIVISRHPYMSLPKPQPVIPARSPIKLVLAYFKRGAREDKLYRESINIKIPIH